MTIKNVGGRQFSLEGVVIESGQSKTLPDDQAKKFLDIHSHTGWLVEVDDYEEVKSVPKETVAKATPVTVQAQVADTVAVKETADDNTPPPLKVFKPRKKQE